MTTIKKQKAREKAASIITLGISSCLLGNDTRYDGGNKLDRSLRDTLGRFIVWTPICPEVESGLGVPREPMRLMRAGQSLRLIGISTGSKRTGSVMRWSRKRVKELSREGICGAVLKARSPSCGVRDAVYVEPSGRKAGRGPGLFAGELAARCSGIPIEDEERLRDPRVRLNFFERVAVYRRWQELLKTERTTGALIDFHSRHKYLLMAHSIGHLRKLGSLAAKAKEFSRPVLFEEYGRIMMDCLGREATVKKHVNVLQHMAGYFKKRLSGDEKRELNDAIGKYHQGTVPRGVPVAIINRCIDRYGEPYLAQQVYLDPDPLGLAPGDHA